MEERKMKRQNPLFLLLFPLSSSTLAAWLYSYWILLEQDLIELEMQASKCL